MLNCSISTQLQKLKAGHSSTDVELILSGYYGFQTREALFFGDNFFKLVTIGFKFSHHPFQPKRRYPSIWSLNKISKFRVPVIDP